MGRPPWLPLGTALKLTMACAYISPYILCLIPENQSTRHPQNMDSRKLSRYRSDRHSTGADSENSEGGGGVDLGKLFTTYHVNRPILRIFRYMPNFLKLSCQKGVGGSAVEPPLFKLTLSDRKSSVLGQNLGIFWALVCERQPCVNIQTRPMVTVNLTECLIMSLSDRCQVSGKGSRWRINLLYFKYLWW